MQDVIDRRGLAGVQVEAACMTNDKQFMLDWLERHQACHEGYAWAEAKCGSLEHVWMTAKAEWLLWVATRPGVLPDRELRLFACRCARQVWHLLTDERSRAAVDVAERSAIGHATDEDLAAASAAARAARDAAWAASVAARAAASAAAWAAAWDAMDAASVAARAAARGAAWDEIAADLRTLTPTWRLE